MKNFLLFCCGFSAGVCLGLIAAPAAGEHTRASLAEKARGVARIPEEKAQQAADIAKEKAGDLGSQIGRQAAESAVEALKENVLGKQKPA